VKPYKEIPHTADWALLVWGRTSADLFANAARGMYDLMGGEPESASEPQPRLVTLEANDLESLLVAWLNELLYLTESEGLLFEDFETRLDGQTRLEARLAGRPAAAQKKQIKAATFHNLQITRSGNGVEATIVFDV
jgi:SHS2 domain-containing protein